MPPTDRHAAHELEGWAVFDVPGREAEWGEDALHHSRRTVRVQTLLPVHLI
jgi:hypothetical protein